MNRLAAALTAAASGYAARSALALRARARDRREARERERVSRSLRAHLGGEAWLMHRLPVVVAGFGPGETAVRLAVTTVRDGGMAVYTIGPADTAPVRHADGKRPW